MAWYQNDLLPKALDIGDRLLAAFNTSTGIPYPKVIIYKRTLHTHFFILYLSYPATLKDLCSIFTFHVKCLGEIVPFWWSP